MNTVIICHHCHYLRTTLSKKHYFSGFRWSFWVLIYILIDPSTWPKLICSKNSQISVKHSLSNFPLILARRIQELSWFFLILAHLRSVTVFGRNRPKMGDDLENLIRYLNSLHESSWKEVFLRKFKSKLFGVRSCLYEKNYLTQLRHLTWAISRQNGVFHL